jgi:hypothetical protein
LFISESWLNANFFHDRRNTFGEQALRFSAIQGHEWLPHDLCFNSACEQAVNNQDSCNNERIQTICARSQSRTVTWCMSCSRKIGMQRVLPVMLPNLDIYPSSAAMNIQGSITKSDDTRGFDFITPASGGKQIFLHIKSLRPGHARLRELL